MHENFETSTKISLFLKKGTWLQPAEKEILQIVCCSPLLNKLEHAAKEELFCLLISILYAEKRLKKNGRKFTYKLEFLLEKLSLHSFFCVTIGMWNFHISHATHFGYKKREFRKILKDNETATFIVIQHLIEDLGLKKAPELIFAEYNHNKMATSVAALQKALNTLSMEKKEYWIKEDGLIGPDTREAIDRSISFLPSFFSLETINEEMVVKTLKFFEEKYGLKIAPFVPPVVVTKDFKFLWEVCKKGFKNGRNPFRLRAFFERNINVPLYVKEAMQAYQFLKRTVS